MTDEDIAIPVPADYDEKESEAFRAGVRTCAQLFGQAAETYYHAAGSDESDGDEDACDDCGAEPIASMGAPATITPEGTTCPECEL